MESRSDTGLFPADKKLKERFLVFAGSASLVIFFSVLIGWVGGSVYSWAAKKAKESSLEDIVNSNKISDTDKTIAILKNALKQLPNNPLLRMQLAAAYCTKAKESESTDIYHAEASLEAEKAWQGYVEQNNGNIDLSDPLGFRLKLFQADIFFECGKPKKAESIYSELENFLVENETAAKNFKPIVLASFYNNLAFSILGKQNLTQEEIDKANDLMKKCMKASPKSVSSPEFLDTLALLFMKEGKKKKSLRLAKESLAKVGKNRIFEYIKRYEYFEQKISSTNNLR